MKNCRNKHHLWQGGPILTWRRVTFFQGCERAHGVEWSWYLRVDVPHCTKSRLILFTNSAKYDGKNVIPHHGNRFVFVFVCLFFLISFDCSCKNTLSVHSNLLSVLHVLAQQAQLIWWLSKQVLEETPYILFHTSRGCQRPELHLSNGKSHIYSHTSERIWFHSI